MEHPLPTTPTPPPTTQRRLAWPWGWRGALLAALLAVAGLAAVAWRGRPPVVEGLVLQTQPLQRSLQFSARVQTPARVEVGSTLTGRVAKVLVAEGATVAAGAPLLVLEEGELQAALQQAQANLRQALARSASQRAINQPGADAAWQQAEATRAAAERELSRTRDLVAQGFLSPARGDEAQRNLAVASAQRDAARAQAQANQADGPEPAGLEAQGLAAAAAVQLARVRLDQATLRSPAAATVIARQVEPGQIVQPGRALLTLSVRGPTELVAQVDERFLGQLQVGQQAQVLADAYPTRPFPAVLARVAPGVDAARGAVEVVFTPTGVAPDFLREDMTLSVEAITGERARALVLPLRALRPPAADGGARVLVLVDGRAQERRVSLGLRTLDQAEVTAGLAAGDTLLLDPQTPPGTHVRLRTAP
jgi:HlyD family secretion protein